MKRVKVLILGVVLAIFGGVFPALSVAAASDPGLYFENAAFDYYLEKTENGTKMRVREEFDAVFSTASTSHGLTRVIPFTNQNGKNVTISNLSITATRNGVSEPIAKVEKRGGYFEANIGSASRTVQGRQKYVLEYEFSNVITEYDSAGADITGSGSGVDHQELYWDTNGTGWANRFLSVTANIHLPSGVSISGSPYCYTGRSGSTARNCTISKISDGYSFQTTEELSAYQNMTIDLEFAAGTFVAKRTDNYLLVIVAVILTVACGVILYLVRRSYRKHVREKRAYLKGLLTPPQYQPPKDLTVAEAGDLYLGTKRPTQTATLLELAISHKVQLVAEKKETGILKREKTNYKVKVLDIEGITDAQKDILEILSGGATVSAGSEIEVKTRTATRKLSLLLDSYKTDAREPLWRKGYYDIARANSTKGGVLGSMAIWFAIPFVAIMLFFAMAATLALLTDPGSLNLYGELVGSPWIAVVGLLIVVVTTVVTVVVGIWTARYDKYTFAGLEASNYLEGLRLYISMAEKERLEFNQSVGGAFRDDKGTVKLYEKLLPYACLFGLEESWFKEIQKFTEVYEPDWYYGSDPFTYGMFYGMMTHTSSTIASNTSWGNSASSSGFSGGDGGGFSGGGGGGGGGGSW